MPIPKEELDAMLAEADRKIELEQVENNLTPEQFAQKERSKWRWSGSVSRGMLLGLGDLAVDFNAGITGLLGPDVQDWFAGLGGYANPGDPFGKFGIGRRHDALPLTGMTGAAAETTAQAMAMAATMGAGLTANATRQGFALLPTLENPSLTGRIGADILKGIEQNPNMFFGGEAAGGFGSGLAMAGAKEAGAPEGMVPYAGMLGGVGFGALPVFGFNFGRRAWTWSMSHLTPFLDGGETLAATRLQGLARDPMTAAGKARNAPEGISPARATEDRNLMALEARVLSDDPASEAEFADALERARQIATSQLRDFHGTMRLPGEWERNVIQGVAAEGTQIVLSNPQAMLKQARRSFEPVYKQFGGYPVKPKIEAPEGDLPLDQVFKVAAMDDTVLAADSERKVAQAFLQNELSRIKNPNVDRLDDTIDSSKLLFLRQQLRDKISDLRASRKRGDHITASLLGNAEAAITKLFQQQLPDEAMGALAQIDNQYNTYRVVEQAVTTSGERKLSPEAMGRAIKNMMPSTGSDLRKLARAGRNVGDALGDVRALKLMVQGQPGNVRKQIQGDYFHEIWSRSTTKQITPEDEPLVSGERYLQNLIAHKDSAAALGIPKEDYNRAVEIAKQIKLIEAKSPQALKETLADGPATILQLMATLVGAKWGSHMSKIGPGGGMGSSLVLAQFGSQRAKRWMSTFFAGDATNVLIQASKNKELYAALLTKSTAKASEQDKAVRVIASWMGAEAQEAFDHDDEGGGR